MLGSARSSVRGIHHAFFPSRARTAGTRVIRTRKASTNTPTASPMAIGLIVAEPSGMNAAKTEIMMIAAAVTTRALPMNPVRMAWFAWPVWT